MAEGGRTLWLGLEEMRRSRRVVDLWRAHIVDVGGVQSRRLKERLVELVGLLVRCREERKVGRFAEV
jgi:hypothetical protein